MAEDREPSYWELLLPWQQRLFKALVLILAPAIVLAILAPALGMVWIFGSLVYYLFKLIHLVHKQDRYEQERRKFDKTFMDELRDIEASVTGVIPGFKRKRRNRPRSWNSRGEPFLCIICSNYANKGGKYCYEHDHS